MKMIQNLISALAAIAFFIPFASAAFARDAAEPRVVRVGTEAAYPPHNFIAADGVIDGYDIAILYVVNEMIPELEFEYVPVAWDGLFAALEAGELDIIASSIGKNAERKARYLFSEIPYRYEDQSIIFKKDRADIHSLDDLFGKTVAVSTGTQIAGRMEEFNEKNGNQIKLVYTDGNLNNTLLGIDSGRVDAVVNDMIPASFAARELGIEIDSRVIREFSANPIYFLFRKSDDGMYYRELIDKALEQLAEDGVLMELSIEYLGDDYTLDETARGN